MGFRNLCGKNVCPILIKAQSMLEIKKVFQKKDFFGASPPSLFVGEYGYPKIAVGPLLPPLATGDTAIYDDEEQWIHESIQNIIGYRTSLVRGKKYQKVSAARIPDKTLSIAQELVMAGKSVDTEMSFIKRPRLDIVFSSREPPAGPAGFIKKARLTENPRIPRPVEKVVSDTDLKATGGILKLYDEGIKQRQITRMMSAGLFGQDKSRKLVPTTWSITAVDDIIGETLRRKILTKSWINEVLLFGHEAVGNAVQILLYPSAWLYEALEYWSLTLKGKPMNDWENWYGRKDYASDLAGAYYAVKLPVLEYLTKINRQAGVLAFLEVRKDWVPLGVWRFREIAREAFRKPPIKTISREKAYPYLEKRLQLPLEKWLETSATLRFINRQKTLDDFLPKDLMG
jgi:hypothetical protein